MILIILPFFLGDGWVCETDNINGETNRKTEGDEGKFQLCTYVFRMGLPFVCLLFFLLNVQASEGRG